MTAGNNDVTAVRCFAGTCSVQEYFFVKSKFFNEHPTAEILEEIKTLTVKEVKPQMLPLPGTQPSLHLQAQVTQVHFAFWYMETLTVAETKKIH